MPFSKVDPKVDFPAQEREILAFWDKIRAFDTLREINRGKPKWSFLDGPITANNPMGVHHAWGRTYKDLYQRYFASMRRELRYQNGFDCQGLWVEVEVEKEHNFSDKRQIEEYGIDRFVGECKARAAKFAAIQTEQSKQLGQWMDWDNSYYTMSDENNYAIWAFLKKCHQKGLVYKGVDVMPWCPRCGTGISQMEMNEGYREVPHTSVFIRLPLRGRRGEFLLVWTTTPWTLTSNVAAAVRPDMTYLKIGQGGEVYYVGKANFERARTQPVEGLDRAKLPNLMAIQAMFKNKGPFEILGELRGEELVGLTYDGPFDHLPGATEAVTAHRVIPWEAVTESEGAGIVHIAPGCGAEDYALGKELGLPQIAPLFENGRFRPEFGPLAGKRFSEVADTVAADLKERGLLFAKESYYHRYPHCWRCKEELVYRLVDEWFISMNWREQIMQSARQARWIPSWGVEREIDWLRNMGDWMISKKRYWGLALPIWECHACGHFEVIGGRDELQSRAVSGWDRFEGHSPHRPWVDDVKIRCAQCGDQNVSRIKDVGNPWLDASIVPFSTMGYFTDRESWKEWFPADFVVEALPGQFRNWFYALLTVSTMMEGCSPFKVLKGHGMVLDDNGEAMHKSKGNAIWFEDAAAKFGVDVMRWLYAATPPERNVLFGPKHCDEVRRDVLIPWWNVYAFFCNLARVDDFRPKEHLRGAAAHRSLLDRWILSDLAKLVKLAHEAYSQFEIVRFCAEAQRFIEVLSSWYVRRSRRRFYETGWPDDKRAAYATLYEVLHTFNRLVAPIMPFLSETMYQHLGVAQSDGAPLSVVPASVHHLTFPTADESRIDEALSQHVAASLRLMTLARSARKESQLKIRQPLAEMIVVPADDAERKAVELFGDHFLEEINVKRVTLRESGEGLFTTDVAPSKKVVFQQFGKNGQAVMSAIAALPVAQRVAAAAQGVAAGVTVAAIPGEPDIPLTREMFNVAYAYAEGYAGAVDGKSAVIIDKRLTPELVNEGIAREIIRQVQELRKSADLDIADRIRLSLVCGDKAVSAAIDACRDYIAEEVLAVELVRAALPAPTSTTELDLDGAKVGIGIMKA